MKYLVICVLFIGFLGTGFIQRPESQDYSDNQLSEWKIICDGETVTYISQNKRDISYEKEVCSAISTGKYSID